MILSKWGNSLAVRIPTAMVKALGLTDGDDVEITINRKPTAELLAELREFRGRIPADFKFNREELHERGEDS
jgi:antitoxin MazE